MGQINHTFEVPVALQWQGKEDVRPKRPLSCSVPLVISLLPRTLHPVLYTGTQHRYKLWSKLSLITTEERDTFKCPGWDTAWY